MTGLCPGSGGGRLLWDKEACAPVSFRRLFGWRVVYRVPGRNVVLDCSGRTLWRRILLRKHINQ